MGMNIINIYLKPGVFELEKMSGVSLYDTAWGEKYLIVYGFDINDSKANEIVKKNADRIEAVCVFTPDQGRREYGIYRSDKIIAELDRSTTGKEKDYILRLKGPGDCLKEIEALYQKIRAGNIRPNPCDSYGKDQCKENPRLASNIIRRINKILFKGFFFPFGFWKEVRNIVREAESKIAT